MQREAPSNERKPGHGDVPMVVAPGREEEYLAMMQEEEEKERVETAKRETEKTATEQDNMADKHPTESGETQGKRNENGWGDLFGTFGLDGLDDIHAARHPFRAVYRQVEITASAKQPVAHRFHIDRYVCTEPDAEDGTDRHGWREPVERSRA